MDDLCFQECQDVKSKNYLYKDSQRSSALRPQFMHVHRAMHQIISGMFWFNSHILEYCWFHSLMELYWPLGDCRFVHFLINCLECGWPGSLIQVITGKSKSRAKLLIPWRMRLLSNPKLIRTQDSWGHLTSGLCQMNHSFKQFGETHFSNFSPKFSSWSCPSGPCEKGVSLGHSRLVDRNKHKTKGKQLLPSLFYSENCWNIHCSNHCSCKFFLYHFLPVLTFTLSFWCLIFHFNSMLFVEHLPCAGHCEMLGNHSNSGLSHLPPS